MLPGTNGEKVVIRRETEKVVAHRETMRSSASKRQRHQRPTLSAAASPPGTPALARAFGAFLAAPILQIPWILHAEAAGPARRQHALLVRGEGAAGAVVAIAGTVLYAPGSVDLSGHRTAIKGGERCDREQREGGADHMAILPIVTAPSD
jgi:hypothetical protein